MPDRNSRADWSGDLKNGNGHMSLGSGAFKGSYSFKSRFEDGDGTNPEELIGAAHAGCYVMAFSAALAEDGYEPELVTADAEVSLEIVDGDFAITTITLNVEGEVPDISEDTFQVLARGAVKDCPVSKALAALDIKLNATLKN